MKTNFVLIDYENVQPEAVAELDKEHFKVMVFVGANQAKVTFEVASMLQRMGGKAEYIKITGNGSNALDFHIAFYIGQLAAREPDACFHIISKDAGFDPLIQHLKDRKILVGRSKSVMDMPLVKAANAQSSPDRLTMIIGDLKRRGTAKPRVVRTLSNTINALFQKQLSEKELTSMLTELQSRGVIEINDTKVSYTLPA
ncbi:MAG: PIN domain-containing protein [Thiobacillus sp.]|nr:PIN domain-containing protein [Thiobacillus sp.]